MSEGMHPPNGGSHVVQAGIIGDGWFTPSLPTSGYLCGACGGWVPNGVNHLCGRIFVQPTRFPTACRHCYCIDVPPSGERTKEHHKCCKCQDVQVKP